MVLAFVFFSPPFYQPYSPSTNLCLCMVGVVMPTAVMHSVPWSCPIHACPLTKGAQSDTSAPCTSGCCAPSVVPSLPCLHMGPVCSPQPPVAESPGRHPCRVWIPGRADTTAAVCMPTTTRRAGSSPDRDYPIVPQTAMIPAWHCTQKPVLNLCNDVSTWLIPLVR